MKEPFILTFTFLAALSLPACRNEAPGAMDDPSPEVACIKVSNSGFTDLSGDTPICLMGPGEVSLTQTITGLTDGTYSLEFLAKSSGGQQACYVEAAGRMTYPETSPDVWKKCYVRNIEVHDGQLQISLHSQSDVSSSLQLSGFQLLRDARHQEVKPLIKGGDISELTLVEQQGGKFRLEGQEVDCIHLLKEGGMNLVRLRLYNDPGNAAYSPSCRLPAGIEDEADILSLASRAKQEGMQIELTFHYSDYWSNGAMQIKPHDWQQLDREQLEQAVYDYTYQFLQKMNAQGTAPEYVSLGNEIQSGILFGEANGMDMSKLDEVNGYCSDMMHLAALLQRGSAAVRAACPDAKVILHLTMSTNVMQESYEWFLGEMEKYCVDYDVIGASYYPFWTQLTASEACQMAEQVTDRFDKDLLFMETGYAWSSTIDDGRTQGQLSHNRPYTDLSQHGQKEFMLELTNAIQRVPNRRVLGYIYWDPIFIPAGDAGWELGGKNIVSNSALFDFEGNAIEVWDAYRWNR